MKATELMVGDWVKNMVHNTYCKVDVDALRLLPDWPLEPIPLTVEILKKNGFKKYHYDGWVHYYGYKTKWMPFPFVVHGMVGGEMLSREEGFGISTKYGGTFSCDYVHQLQQALRLCRLNDLADNFKVE